MYMKERINDRGFSTPTKKLISACRSAHWQPTPSSIQPFIDDGADITIPAVEGKSILHCLAQDGCLPIIQLCLSSSSPIDFTRLDVMSCTILHHLCDYSVEAEKSAAILRLIVQRLETHPQDIADWSQKDIQGRDFIRAAAFHQRLSLFWAIIQELPFFADTLEPFNLSCQTVWKWDWENLMAHDNTVREYFVLDNEAMIQADILTSTLVQCCWKAPLDVEDVRHLVSSGANVEFSPPGMNWCILKHFVLSGSVECVNICLSESTNLSSSFLSSRDAFGRNIFACCLGKGKRPEDVQRLLDHLLKCAVNRFPHNIEEIEWDAAKVWSGTCSSFLSLAATYGLLSVVWPILKAYQIPFFCSRLSRMVDSKSIFPLTGDVYLSDVEQLDMEDFRCFKLPPNAVLK